MNNTFFNINRMATPIAAFALALITLLFQNCGQYHAKASDVTGSNTSSISTSSLHGGQFYQDDGTLPPIDDETDSACPTDRPHHWLIPNKTEKGHV